MHGNGTFISTLEMLCLKRIHLINLSAPIFNKELIWDSHCNLKPHRDIWSEFTQALYSKCFEHFILSGPWVGIEPMTSHAPLSGLQKGKQSSPLSHIRSLKKHVSMSQWTRHYLCHLGIVIWNDQLSKRSSTH